jgi:hypothetical protein
MGFSRARAPSTLPATGALTSAMVGIGMKFAAPAAIDPNIEDTLLFASVEGMERGDLRVLATLTSWFGVHAPWVNADRLITLVRAQPARVRAYWAALARWQGKDRRFARLLRGHGGARVDVLAAGTEFQLRRHGEDERFTASAIRAPANLLADRPGRVLAPEELARHHVAYRCRLMMGPSYRADMWAALEDDATLTASELARVTYGSFATAWHVRRDFALVAASRRRVRQRTRPA